MRPCSQNHQGQSKVLFKGQTERDSSTEEGVQVGAPGSGGVLPLPQISCCLYSPALSSRPAYSASEGGPIPRREVTSATGWRRGRCSGGISILSPLESAAIFLTQSFITHTDCPCPQPSTSLWTEQVVTGNFEFCNFRKGR